MQKPARPALSHTILQRTAYGTLSLYFAHRNSPILIRTIQVHGLRSLDRNPTDAVPLPQLLEIGFAETLPVLQGLRLRVPFFSQSGEHAHGTAVLEVVG